MRKFLVTSEQDSGPGSLRDVVSQAMATDSSATIEFNTNVYRISLTSLIEFTRGDITIRGRSENLGHIYPSIAVAKTNDPLDTDLTLLFEVGENAKLTLENVDLSGGIVGGRHFDNPNIVQGATESNIALIRNSGTLSIDSTYIDSHIYGRAVSGTEATTADDTALFINEASGSASINGSFFDGIVDGGEGRSGASGGDAAPIINFGSLSIERTHFDVSVDGGDTQYVAPTANNKGGDGAQYALNYGNISGSGPLGQSEFGEPKPGIVTDFDYALGEYPEAMVGAVLSPIENIGEGASSEEFRFGLTTNPTSTPREIHILGQSDLFFSVGRDANFRFHDLGVTAEIIGGTPNDTLSFDSFALGLAPIVLDISDEAQQNVTDQLVLELVGVEHVNASAFDDRITGNRKANILDGGGGADTLFGGEGNDSLFARDSAETVHLSGGEGDDLLRLQNVAKAVVYGGDETSDDGFDILHATGVFSLIDQGGSSAKHDPIKIFGIDGLRGFSTNDHFTGDNSGNLLEGVGGEDTLLGLGGDDTISLGFGGAVVQTIHADGGSGDDDLIIVADAGELFGGTGSDRIDFRFYSQNGGDVNIDGGDDDDIIKFEGLEGAVTVFGGSGKDTISGQFHSGFADGGDGNDHIHSVFTVQGGEGDDFIWNSPHVEGGGGSDTVTGRFSSDTIFGGAGADELIGRGGADEINGGRGNDKITGSKGDDTLFGGSGGDRLFGGGAQDSIQGGGGRDLVVGGGAGDFIDGSGGRDTVKGNGGSDTLIGSGGRDLLIGGNGNDTLDGGRGADSIFGGAGSDLLLGTHGDDVLVGGAGRDFFIFSSEDKAGPRGDLIKDFQQGIDKFAIFGEQDGIEDFQIEDTSRGALVESENISFILEGRLAKAISETDFLFLDL